MSFNTPPENEILQEDETDPVIPVHIAGVVRTDRLPGHIGSCRSVLLESAGLPIKVLEKNPRRKRAVFWQWHLGSAPASTTVAALISSTYADALAFQGLLLFSVNAIVRYELEVTDEIWARGVNVAHSSGDLLPIAASSQNDIWLSTLSEDWAQ